MINVDRAIIEGFKKFDTTSVSDALDRLGIVGGLRRQVTLRAALLAIYQAVFTCPHWPAPPSPSPSAGCG